MSKLYDREDICGSYFFPQPAASLPEGRKAGPVCLRLEDGTEVSGYGSRPLEDAPTLLYLHGNGERIADQLGHWPSWAQRAGLNVFFVDYPGYALSQGRPSFSSCSAAARAALDYLLESASPPITWLLVGGRSVGSIFAMDAAAACRDSRLRGLFLESGVADIRPRLAMRLDYPALGLDQSAVEAELASDYDHQRKLESLACPLLLLHSRHDGLVPAHNSEQMAAWAGPKLHRLVLFEEGDHNTIQWINAEAYQEELASFVRATAPDAR